MSRHSLRTRSLASASAIALAVAALYAPGTTAREVGTAAAVVPSVRGEPPDAPVREIRLGASVIFNERIVTSSEGQTQIVFLDKSTLTVGPDADVVLDRFVYDPDRGTGEMVISIGRGIFRFVGGRIGASEGVTIRTPTATVGIRGSIVIGRVAPFLLGWLEGEEIEIFNALGRLQRGRGDFGLRNARSHRVPGARGIGRWYGTPDGGPPQDLGRIDRPTLLALLRAMHRRPDLPPDEGIGRDEIEEAHDRSGGGDPEIAGTDPPPDPGNGGQAIEHLVGDRDDTELPLAGLNQEEGIGSLPPPDPTPGASGLALLPDPMRPVTSFFLGGPDASLPLEDLAIGPERVFATFGDDRVVDFPVLAAGVPFDLPENTPDLALPYGFSDARAFVDGNGAFFALRMPQLDLRMGELPAYAYVTGGVPTPGGGNVNFGSGIARYEILTDVGFGGPIPFVPFVVNPLLQSAFADPGAGVGALHAALPSGPAVKDNPSAPGTRLAQATLLVDGERDGQNSLLMITGGSLVAPDGKVAAELRSLGSVAADGIAFGRLGATPGTLPGAAGDHFFGPALDFATLTQGEAGVARLDAWADGVAVGAETGFTYPIAKQGFEPGLNRTNATLHGFATVAGRSITGTGSDTLVGAPYLLATRDGDPTGVEIDLPPNHMPMTAEFDLGAVGPGPVQAARFTFGGTVDDSFRLDDGRFAAFGTTEVDGQAGDGPGAALVSSGLLAADPWTPGGAPFCTDCDFLSWGWWTASHQPAEGDLAGREHFHIGTWVAADLAPRIQIVNASGSASFAGRMVGNAVLDGTPYVATGDFSASWSFDSGTGSFDGSFDGFGFGGDIGLVDGMPNTPARFAGTVAGDAGPADVGAVAGRVDGAFATGPQGPASGMIGQMAVTDVDGRYGAAASFAGTQAPAID